MVTAITNSAGVFSAYALVVVMNNSFGSRSGFNDIRKLEDVCVCVCFAKLTLYETDKNVIMYLVLLM